MITTSFSCPMRCTRATACCSIAGSIAGSSRYTRVAAVSVSPAEPARSDSRNTHTCNMSNRTYQHLDRLGAKGELATQISIKHCRTSLIGRHSNSQLCQNFSYAGSALHSVQRESCFRCVPSYAAVLLFSCEVQSTHFASPHPNHSRALPAPRRSL